MLPPVPPVQNRELEHEECDGGVRKAQGSHVSGSVAAHRPVPQLQQHEDRLASQAEHSSRLMQHLRRAGITGAS